MSHIVKNKDDLMMVKDIFDLLIRDGISINVMEEVVRNLLPRDNNNQLLIDYQIYDEYDKVAFFSPRKNCIFLSINEMDLWIERKIDGFRKIGGFITMDTILKKYMVLFIVVHEIEHSYQYLMGKGIKESPCKLVGDAYNILFSFLIQDDSEVMKNLISHFLYYINKSGYVIERNANVEATALLRDLAMLHEQEEISHFFHELMCSQLAIGYVKNNKGSFEETFRNILMLKQYRQLDHEIDLSDAERIRYGLPISKDIRRKNLVRK